MKYERPIKHFGFGHFQPLQVVSMPANLQDLHHLIAQGQHEAAALWLKHMPVYLTMNRWAQVYWITTRPCVAVEMNSVLWEKGDCES